LSKKFITIFPCEFLQGAYETPKHVSVNREMCYRSRVLQSLLVHLSGKRSRVRFSGFVHASPSAVIRLRIT